MFWSVHIVPNANPWNLICASQDPIHLPGFWRETRGFGRRPFPSSQPSSSDKIIELDVSYVPFYPRLPVSNEGPNLPT